MESRMTALTIGQVADAADVNIQTIRYYERRGLFPTPRRTPAGYRQYADDAVARLRVVGVLAIPCRSAARSRKQATPLVITDRLDVHVGRVRDLTDGQRRHSALH